MEKIKKEQAEKLQIKLDKLLQLREKKQQVFDKAKKELSSISKDIDNVKLKLFEILQSGSDDIAFSNWAKRKIGESENLNNGKNKNEKIENHTNINSQNSQKPETQNHQSQPNQNNNLNHHTNKSHQQPQQQNLNQ